MAFTHVQGAGNNTVSSVTTLNVVLPANPTPGNMVCVAFASVSVSAFGVQDSAGNIYTVTPLSPSPFITGAGEVWLAYLLNAPANATKTLTATWTTASLGILWADEFSAATTVVFDQDVEASAGAGNGTSINTPVIVPTAPNSLVYAAAGDNGTITAPAANATLGAWTGAVGGIQLSGAAAEFDLSVTGSQAVQYTQSSAVAWVGMAMAFYEAQDVTSLKARLNIKIG